MSERQWILRNTIEKEPDHIFDEYFKKHKIEHIFNQSDIDKLPLSERARSAVFNLPYGQSEVGIALRLCIKDRKKANEDYTDLFTFYYHVCAVLSMVRPYSKKLGMSGFNILEAIPGGLLFSLPVKYSALGYEKILQKSDYKHAVELWGEPLTHKTFNQVYRKTWTTYEDFLYQESLKEDESFKEKIGKLSDSMTEHGMDDETKKSFFRDLIG